MFTRLISWVHAGNLVFASISAIVSAYDSTNAMSQHDELKQLIEADSDEGERRVVKWLKKDKENTLVLSRAVSKFGFPNLVVAEFQLGTDRKAAFALLGRYSGGFSIHFVEIEPPNAKLYTKQGVPHKRLAGAIKQIEDWKIFVETKRSMILDELEKAFKSRELIWGTTREVIDNAGLRLHDPIAWLQFYYHIIIGRRKTMSADDLQRKAAALHLKQVEILTFDRSLEFALNERGSISGPRDQEIGP